MTASTHDRKPALICPDGKVIELNLDAYSAAVEAIRAISRPQSTSDYITTGKASELLGVSRQTINRMIESGELECTRVGRNHHRRIRRSDVLALLDKSASQRHENLEALRVAAFDGGLYDIDVDSGNAI